MRYCMDCSASVETYSRVVITSDGEDDVTYCGRCDSVIGRERRCEI